MTSTTPRKSSMEPWASVQLEEAGLLPPKEFVPVPISEDVLHIIEESSTSETSSDEFVSPSDTEFVQEGPAYQGQDATNRETFGTWNKPFDFTLTCSGYIIGFYNFFRFPHLCYKYGVFTFVIPYAVLLLIVGGPLLFMEFTIGQYHGVGPVTAFKHLAPVLTGVSYVLAWNSFINVWMFGSIVTWVRAYSGDSLSCLKGWIGCAEEHYFNTPFCWTGNLDECCNDFFRNYSDKDTLTQCPNRTESLRSVSDGTIRGHNPPTHYGGPHPLPHLGSLESMWYNYECIPVYYFCELFNWTQIPGRRSCLEADNVTVHPVYERRIHAVYEYFYGYVLGVRKVMAASNFSDETLEVMCQRSRGTSCSKIKDHDLKFNRTFFKDLKKLVAFEPKYISDAWNKSSQLLQPDPASSSYVQMPTFLFTTCLLMCLFLFDDLLSVSILNYFLNVVPFIILIYVTAKSTEFNSAREGLKEFFDPRDLQGMLDMELWVEALITVIVTTGVGTGALINLASFNKFRHSFTFDIVFVLVLTLLTSLLATLICFCTIGHYQREYEVTTDFQDFINSDMQFSSVQFGFIVHSLLFSLLEGQDVTVLLYFFMLSSFPTDTAIRLAQNILDTTMYVLPRLRFHPTMTLIGVLSFYFLTILPVMRNGGIVLYVECEFFSMRCSYLLINLIQVVSVGWVYGGSKLIENAQELKVVGNRIYMKLLQLTIQFLVPIILSVALIHNFMTPWPERINSLHTNLFKKTFYTTVFGWLFSLVPIIMLALSVLKQLATYPKNKWKTLWISQSNIRRVARKISKQLRKPKVEPQEDGPSIRKRLSIKSKRPSNFIRKPKTGSGTPEAQDKSKKELISSKGKHRTLSKLRQSGEKTQNGPDNLSINSSELEELRSYVLWHKIVSYFEDWPNRIDDSEMESEGSSDSSDGEPYEPPEHERRAWSRESYFH